MKIEAIIADATMNIAALYISSADGERVLFFYDGLLQVAVSEATGAVASDAAEKEVVGAALAASPLGRTEWVEVPDVLMSNMQNDAASPEHWANIVNYVKHARR